METMKKWSKRLVVFAGFMLAINIALYMGIVGVINITDMVMWLLEVVGVL